MKKTRKYVGGGKYPRGGTPMNPARKKSKENNDRFFLKFCKTCNEENKWYTIANKCVKCVKKQDYQRNRTPERQEKKKWNDIQKHYGLDKDEWYWMYKEQGGKCLMCGIGLVVTARRGEQRALQACIDHDHKTGKIGGMLCHRCNIVIGYAGDDVNLLQLGIIYLKEAREINVN